MGKLSLWEHFVGKPTDVNGQAVHADSQANMAGRVDAHDERRTGRAKTGGFSSLFGRNQGSSDSGSSGAYLSGHEIESDAGDAPDTSWLL